MWTASLPLLIMTIDSSFWRRTRLPPLNIVYCCNNDNWLNSFINFHRKATQTDDILFHGIYSSLSPSLLLTQSDPSETDDKCVCVYRTRPRRFMSRLICRTPEARPIAPPRLRPHSSILNHDHSSHIKVPCGLMASTIWSIHTHSYSDNYCIVLASKPKLVCMMMMNFFTLFSCFTLVMWNFFAWNQLITTIAQTHNDSIWFAHLNNNLILHRIHPMSFIHQFDKFTWERNDAQGNFE